MKRVCNLEILVDHTLFQSVLEDSNGEEEKARETITSIIHTHTASVSEIFKGTSFNGITDIVFEVQRVQVNDSSSCEGRVRRTNPFCRDDLDATHALLELSKINHEHFCASYLWTHRDFQGGTLGLAFLAEAGSDTGGICDLHHFGANVDVASKYHGELSLNTGIVTFLNNNIRLSQRDTEITFAHELGHSFGSPHDMSPDCTPGGTEGNFLMYPSARRGIEPNNRKFSECSIRNISSFLHELLAGEGESPNCLQEPRGPFCGNSVREKGEQCDCGYDSTDCVDRCCYPRASGDDKACKLRPNALCSPANDACCTKDCVFRGSTASCRPEDECRLEAFCEYPLGLPLSVRLVCDNGASANCPASLWRPNGTECNLGTQLCEAGECMRSVCHKFGLVQCFLTGPDKRSEERCLLACRKDAPGSECKEACHFDQMAHLCHKRLQPGAACDNLHGYCDVFHRCRPLDAEGPLTRLQWLVFDAKEKRDNGCQRRGSRNGRHEEIN
ncbi:hypothetical protein HPB48_007816 [Haemaphysalis longicornis]|uniref:ADAM10 endopeptidase n=1 Tax=Haemaphysalis longicornis TaxID=44386 RepID=A0A9J6G0I0_HAELO|nr:hypothetical protein HPB48_007816 [Haemaphysalis longicornis]